MLVSSIYVCLVTWSVDGRMFLNPGNLKIDFVFRIFSLIVALIDSAFCSLNFNRVDIHYPLVLHH